MSKVSLSSAPRHRFTLPASLILAALAISVPSSALAQAQSVLPSLHPAIGALPDAPEPQSQASQPASDDPVTVRNSIHIFIQDQKGIWTSPLRLERRDAVWMLPLAGALGASIVTDHRALSQVVSHDPSFNSSNINISNAMVGGIVAIPVAYFVAGEFRNDSHAVETGILGGEAVADSAVVSEVAKLVTWRERPNVDEERGRFFQRSAGYNGSFYSMHTTMAFSAATVIASEYHSPWLQVAAYTAASAVGVTRILGQEHFPSDVLIGATTGWLIGHYVVKHHHHAQ